MRVKGWPFLVSRNKVLGYQAIVAPDFMIEAKIAGLLANEAGGNLTKHPRYRKLKTKTGDITLVYRVVSAIDNNELFRDEFGRPILWIEGIVLKGSVEKIEITEKELQESHRRVENGYREFWVTTSNVSVKPSKPFMIPFEEDAVTKVTKLDKTMLDRQPIETPTSSSEQERRNYKKTRFPLQLAVVILLIISILFNILLTLKKPSSQALKELTEENKELQSNVKTLQKEKDSLLKDNKKLQSKIEELEKNNR